MRPVKAPVVAHEGLYAACFNDKEMFRVRARNAAHAELKLMFLVERETKGKVLDFSLSRHLEHLEAGKGKTLDFNLQESENE